MTASLDGARLKVDRAEEHLDALDREVRAFLDSNPYQVVREFDSQQRSYIFTAKIERPIPPRLGLLIGDGVHNLRAALDHIVWELSLRSAAEPSPYTEFPIFDSKDGWRNNLADKRRSKLRHITDGARDVIERMQPYHRPNPHQSMLWVLHRIDIMDKHRTIPLVQSVVPGPPRMVISATIPPQTTRTLGTFFMGPFNDGDVLASFPEDIDLQDNLEEQFTFEIRFPEGLTKGAELTALRQLHQFIGNEVLPQFEPFF